MPNQLLRSLPSIERLLERPLALQLSAALGRERVRDLLREVTDELRREFTDQSKVQSPKSKVGVAPTLDLGLGTLDLAEEVERRLEARAANSARPSLRRVINATGVILHTNLGRAPLAHQAIEALAETAS